jgi:ABC-2 type transport system permease protein
MRSKRTFWFLSIYLGVLSLFSLFIYWLSVDSMGSASNTQYIGKTLFFSISAIALVEICLIAPALTASSINGEKERQSFDLLVSSMLSPWQIVFGKLLAALSFASILILVILPFLSFSFLFGGVALGELIIAMIGMFCSMLLFSSLGLYCSTRFRSTTGSLISSLGFLIFYMILIPFLMLLYSAFGIDFDGIISNWIFVYFVGFLISFHPFFALGMTAIFVEEQYGYWYFSETFNQVQITIPSPWLGLVLVSLVFSWLLCFLSVKRIEKERFNGS